MGNYYLDIETNGLDAVQNKIISIQYQELERGTGKPIGDLTILKEWDAGEEEMIQKFIVESNIVSTYDFDFVPVGFNLGFEHKFLLRRAAKYNKYPINVLSRPCIDLRNIAILMNNGEFQGSGLDKLTNKPHGGSPVPIWYENKQYDNIEHYIKTETQEFIKLFQWLHRKLPELKTELDKETNSDSSQ